MRANERVIARLALTTMAVAALAACGGGGGESARNELPAGIKEISATVYPATSVGTGAIAATQDLLTGGIGKTGLGVAAAPAYADPANPTAAELRRNALYSNYRGILDPSANGGYGTLYGPNVTAQGQVTGGEGLIPGREYVAVLDDGTGRKQTVIAVQVPDSFSASNPCIVLGASSGSRGVYGAIGTAGEWGLKKGCAVALTDAGKGVGLHNLADDTVNKIDGTRAPRAAAGALGFFAAALSEASIYNYIGLTAMTARAAARCDGLAAKGLVSGATTAERAADALAKLHAFGWTAESDSMHNAHYALGNGPILSAMYTMAYGRFGVEANLCGASFAAASAKGDVVAVAPAVLAQSFAIANGTANGTPATVVYNDSVGGAKAWQFAVSPSTGAADLGLDNALCQYALVSGKDPATGAALTAASTPTKAQSDAVRSGIAEVLHSANLRGKPAIIVAGRSDALIPVNNNARAYTALNRTIEGASSKLRYIEVTNGQHFDAFLPFSGFDTRFVPLHPYFNQAMDAMWAHLKNGAQLPASQVVRTTPRGGTPGAAPAITAAHVPPFVASPAAADQIGFAGTSITVPR